MLLPNPPNLTPAAKFYSLPLPPRSSLFRNLARMALRPPRAKMGYLRFSMSTQGLSMGFNVSVLREDFLALK